jgi:HPt (histidine-containing phosphotransfer) domain-containing protein
MKQGQNSTPIGIKYQDLLTDSPIDTSKPINDLGGNAILYYQMLERLESMSLNKNMQRIAQAVNEKDWDVMKANAHSLKGACGYVGASRLHYACYYI